MITRGRYSRPIGGRRASGPSCFPPLTIRVKKNSFSLHVVPTDSGAHPTSYLMGSGALSLGVKRRGRKGDHSPSSNAKVRNGGAVPPLLHSFHDAVFN
jgi:hypothetical protein